MIEVNGLKKCFGTVQALKNVTFQAHDNKITGILGPNGAGKTTTLRIIYGIIDPNRAAPGWMALMCAINGSMRRSD
jgi:sodium transport system ATP-binding protein